MWWEWGQVQRMSGPCGGNAQRDTWFCGDSGVEAADTHRGMVHWQGWRLQSHHASLSSPGPRHQVPNVLQVPEVNAFGDVSGPAIGVRGLATAGQAKRTRAG